MKIYFKREGNKLVTKEGKDLPTGLISTFPHEFDQNGGGWVELPPHFSSSALGDVKFLGFGEDTPRNKMDSWGNIVTTAPVVHNLHPAQPQTGTEFVYHGPYMGKMDDLNDLDGPIVFADRQDAENFVKIEFLTALGMQRRATNLWYHPVFGTDSDANYMRFDIDKASIEHITTVIFEFGGRRGLSAVRRAIDKLLNL